MEPPSTLTSSLSGRVSINLQSHVPLDLRVCRKTCSCGAGLEGTTIQLALLYLKEQHLWMGSARVWSLTRNSSVQGNLLIDKFQNSRILTDKYSDTSNSFFSSRGSFFFFYRPPACSQSSIRLRKLRQSKLLDLIAAERSMMKLLGNSGEGTNRLSLSRRKGQNALKLRLNTFLAILSWSSLITPSSLQSNTANSSLISARPSTSRFSYLAKRLRKASTGPWLSLCNSSSSRMVISLRARWKLALIQPTSFSSEKSGSARIHDWMVLLFWELKREMTLSGLQYSQLWRTWKAVTLRRYPPTLDSRQRVLLAIPSSVSFRANRNSAISSLEAFTSLTDTRSGRDWTETD